MKKIVVFILFGIIAAMLTVNSGFAKGRFNCDNCNCFDKKIGMGVENTEFKNFKAETLPLRREISEKRFEMEREYLSEHPDETKITKIKDEIKALRDKLYEIRAKHGIQAKKFSPRCY